MGHFQVLNSFVIYIEEHCVYINRPLRLVYVGESPVPSYNWNIIVNMIWFYLSLGDANYFQFNIQVIQ